MDITEKKFIIILGPQGSGKSTQANQLAKHLGYKAVSSGDVLRKLKNEKNPIGLKLSEYWVSGELVPDELIEEILFPILENVNDKGFILDGYPRNLSQLRSFLSFLKINNWKLEYVFYLGVSEKESLTRLDKRAGLENREDETDDAIKRRIEIYQHDTAPLLSEYEKLGKLNKIDGERSIEDIQLDLQKIISKSHKRE